jgi:pimeloyl-ACP methyl ester carboxylesterase
MLAFLEFPRRPEGYTANSEEDRAVTRKLTQHVPDAKFVDVPGGGHYLWMTKQDLVLREIHGFIAQLPPTK